MRVSEFDAAQWVGLLTSAFAGVCALAFCIVYAIIAPWRQTELGREVMLFRLILGLLLVYAVMIPFLPGDWQFWLRIIRGAGVSLVGLLLIRQTHILVRNQVHGRAGKHE